MCLKIQLTSTNRLHLLNKNGFIYFIVSNKLFFSQEKAKASFKVKSILHCLWHKDIFFLTVKNYSLLQLWYSFKLWILNLLLKDLSSKLQVLYKIHWKIGILVDVFYYFVDCYWLIILIFPPLKSVHSVTSTQMSKCSNTHQVTQNLRMRIFLYLWICYRNDKIILL